MEKIDLSELAIEFTKEFLGSSDRDTIILYGDGEEIETLGNFMREELMGKRDVVVLTAPKEEYPRFNGNPQRKKAYLIEPNYFLELNRARRNQS